MKIGRNDSCPCGSGKKYKKCCMDNTENIYQRTDTPNEENNNTSFFKKYNSIDLLKVFAGLSLLPETHGKYVRMEELALYKVQKYNTNDVFRSRESLIEL